VKEIGIKLREAYSGGVERGNVVLREAIEKKLINPERISFKGLAEGMLQAEGSALERKFNEAINRPMNVREQTVVDSSAFYAVTGQILISRVRQKYELATQIGKMIFPIIPIVDNNLQTSREQQISRVPNLSGAVEQGMTYPTQAFAQLYIDFPAPQKFGSQCNVTMELVLADKTRQIYDMADSVGEMTGWEEERRKMRVFLGIVNPYSQNGTAANTYRTSGAWINLLNDFTLVDYKSVNRLEQVLRNQTDPQSGLPLNGMVKDMFVMPVKRYDAKRILNATDIRIAGTATGDLTVSGNPLDNDVRLVPTSQYPQSLAVAEGSYTSAKADTITIAGRFDRALGWKEVYPVRVEQLPPSSERNFDRDILYAVKASGFGVAVVQEPRELVLGYNNAAT
jgi:hypothetical protein